LRKTLLNNMFNFNVKVVRYNEALQELVDR